MVVMKNNLFIGYGNPDRGDDGAAYHLFVALLKDFSKKDVDLFSSDTTSLDANTDIIFNFQLLPEISETIAKYHQVVFIDSHTGNIVENISYEPIEPYYQSSPFTHHFSPSSCLAVAQSLTGRYPKAWLLSIRGFQFGFNRKLSDRTQGFIDQALDIIHNEFFKQ
jgi:hydrogenase maturation protease